jgi:hypothetical protein
MSFDHYRHLPLQLIFDYVDFAVDQKGRRRPEACEIMITAISFHRLKKHNTTHTREI